MEIPREHGVKTPVQRDEAERHARSTYNRHFAADGARHFELGLSVLAILSSLKHPPR